MSTQPSYVNPISFQLPDSPYKWRRALNSVTDAMRTKATLQAIKATFDTSLHATESSCNCGSCWISHPYTAPNTVRYHPANATGSNWSIARKVDSSHDDQRAHDPPAGDDDVDPDDPKANHFRLDVTVAPGFILNRPGHINPPIDFVHVHGTQETCKLLTQLIARQYYDSHPTTTLADSVKQWHFDALKTLASCVDDKGVASLSTANSVSREHINVSAKVTAVELSESDHEAEEGEIREDLQEVRCLLEHPTTADLDGERGVTQLELVWKF